MHSDLIAKLEALDGPSRDVDLELTNIFDKHPDGWSYRWSEITLASKIKTLAAIDLPDGRDELYHQYLGEWGNGNAIISPKYYTASLDATVALVERVLPGQEWSCGSGRKGISEPWGKVRIAPLHSVQENGPTPAIALLIAALKALEAQDG